jgi:AcrR family transcriptional regulator
MPRTVKQEDYTAKRNQILDAVLRLIYTKGYERMTIQDILNELQISKGAFYHYFDSKAALLEALIERMGQEALQLLNPIVHDRHLPALEKLQRYFDTAVRWKTARKTFMLELLHVWYADRYAIVRQKMLAMWSKHLAAAHRDLSSRASGKGSEHRVSRPDWHRFIVAYPRHWRCVC